MYRVSGIIAAIATAVLVLGAARAEALEAYIFRGAGDFTFIHKGLSFSEGMDKLGEELQAVGIPSKVYRWESGEFAYRDIRRRGPRSVALMGHSMGALTAIAIANRLKGSGIRVAYLGLIDIPGPIGATPSNVDIAENYYHAFPVYGHLVKGGTSGVVRNKLIWGQIHITMDNARKVHEGILAGVAEARGDNGIIRAYAAPSQPGEGTDPVLTAATTSQPPFSDDGPVVRSDSTEVVNAPGAMQPGEAAWAQLSMLEQSAIPVPTPSPSRAPPMAAGTASGLPPIE